MYCRFLLWRFFLPILVIVGSLLVSPVYAQETGQGITLGPGLMTYEEIAEALSTPQSPVSCAASVKNRAAFLYLNNRPREATLDLLRKALDVEFRKTNPDATDSPLVLTADPDVARRERTWRLRFANNLDATFRLKVQEIQRYAGWSNEQLAKEDTRLRELLAKEAAKREDEETWKLSRRIYSLLCVYFPVGLRPDTSLANFWLLRNHAQFSANRLIEQGQISVMDTPESLPQPILASLVQNLTPQGGTNPNNRIVFDSLAVEYHLLHYPRRLRIDGVMTLSSSRTTNSHRMILPVGIEIPPHNQFGKMTDIVFRGGRDSIGFPISGLGASAISWFDAEVKETETFRASEAARKFLKEKIGPFDSLSEWLAQWQRQTQGEVIMELWPQSEWGEFGWHKEVEANLVSLSKQFPDWTMKFADNVLIAKNRLAFLDRLPERPTVALVKLIQNTLRREAPEPKTTPKPPDQEGSSPDTRKRLKPSFGDKVNYAAAAINYAPWKPSELIHLYWGIGLSDRDSLVPMEYIWSQLTSEQRAAWRQEKYLPPNVLGNDGLQTLRTYILRFGPNPRVYGVNEIYANPQTRLFYPFINQDTSIP